MATGIRGGGTPTPKPVGPKPSGPLETPHPVLQAAGFHGGIQAFNQKVAEITQAHQKAYGLVPPPGLTMDVAKSDVQPAHYPALFSVPKSPVVAQAQGTLAQHDKLNPATVRQDGIVVPHTPLTKVIQSAQTAHNEAVTQAANVASRDSFHHGDQKSPQSVAQLQKDNPWVPKEAGFLPISSFGKMASAVGVLLSHGQVGTNNGQVTVGGESLSQFQQDAKTASGLGVLSTPAAPPGSAVANMEGLVGAAQKKAIAAGEISTAVNTVRQGQDELKQKFPAYFASLKADGNLGPDWVRAISGFQSSATYYRSSTQQLAHDNYFDNVHDFQGAWKAKQDAIRKDPTGAAFYQHVPLAFFGTGKSVLNFLDGNTHGWGFLNVPTVALHSIVGVAKTGFAGASALSAAAKSNTAATVDYFHRILPTYLGGRGQGEKEALAHSNKVLLENPTWLRAFYPDLPAHPKGALAAVDGISNFALDMFLGNRLVIGGSAVKAGDYAALESNRYFKGATQLAHNSLRARGTDGVGEASRLIQGGEGLNVSVAEAVKSGDMSLGEYRQHVADLYHHGRTGIGDNILHASRTPNGDVLHTLRDKNLPNKSLSVNHVVNAVSDFTDGVANSGFRGVDNAAGVVQSAGRLFKRAAPRAGEKRWFYDPKTPDDIFNWVIKNIGDRDLAYKARNDFVVARTKEDIPNIQALNQSLIERYAAEHPNVKGVPTPLESTGPETESESLSYFKFAGGREKPLSESGTARAFGRLRNQAIARNHGLNRIAAVQRQAIIAGEPLPGVPFPGGESLFWKHATADTARRWAGGGGLRFGLSDTQKAAKSDLEDFFKLNPAAVRPYSANRSGAQLGEVAWINRDRPTEYISFNTGEEFGNPQKMEGAGAFLRHLVTDDALNAYRQSSASDKTALFRHVWHSSFYQNKIATSEDFIKDAGDIKRMVKDGEQQTKLLSDLKKSYAKDWADHLWEQYKAIDHAGEKAGLQNATELAAQVARTNPGAPIDKALGKWIADNKVAFDVRDAPIKASQFDQFSQWWTGKLLTFNKKNRVSFFDHIFLDTFHELTSAGWEQADAVTAATSLAKAQTIHHMLDFSNMLQVEQNLRWLSYYATKHRLYWTWIARQFVHKPLLAAGVNDVAQHLDKRGNFDLHVSLLGHELSIPVSRLFWVNNTEYPETSPPVNVGANVIKNIATGQNPGNAISNAFASQVSTSGNVIGRDDQAISMILKSTGMLGGWVPATFGTAVEGMSPVQRAAFNEEIHNYVIGYRADHDGRYPSEADAVKAATLRTAGWETYRANLFLPIVPSAGKPTSAQKLISQFSQIHDPAKRRKFLDAHPQLSDYFGATQDQDIFLHEQPLWDQFRNISNQRTKELNAIRLQMDKHGASPLYFKEIKAVSQKYSQAIQVLRRQDALTWHGNTTYPAGKVSDNGEISVGGPWGSKLDGDPVAANAFFHHAFPDVSKGQLSHHTMGQTVLDLQNEATRIRELGWKQLGYTDAKGARDRLSQINQKLDVFRSMPKNPTSKMIDAYYSQYVDPYIKVRDKLKAEQAKTSSIDKNVVYAMNRAIKENYDHPVYVTDPVSGQKVKFPSPVSFGYTMLPPNEYHSALASEVSNRWQDISGYVKNLLGVKTDPSVSQGWVQYQESVKAFHDNYPGQRFDANSLARGVDKNYPGFYKDYLFSQQPKIDRFKRTVVYQDLAPAVKLKFDQVIGVNAAAIAGAIKKSKHSTEYMNQWRAYVKSTIVPWLDQPENKDVKAEVDRYGPDFLNTLPSK